MHMRAQVGKEKNSGIEGEKDESKSDNMINFRTQGNV
jgi:hypothetical protein